MQCADGGETRRAYDALRINFICAGETHTPCQRDVFDRRRKRLTHKGGQLLGIADQPQRPRKKRFVVVRQNHRAHRDRSSERAAPGFIQPGDELQSAVPQVCFEFEIWSNAFHICRAMR
jgi:hypothetical protein